MNGTASFVSIFTILTFFGSTALAQIAEVRGVNGEVTYSVGGAEPVSVRKGVSLPVGSVIKTGRGSALDIYLGPAFGTIRLTQNSTLSIDRMEPLKALLTLWDGSFVGWDAKVPVNGTFQVKMSKGILGIVEGKYRVDARSYLVLLNGFMVYAFVMPDSKIQAFTLQASPPVYFSPVEGVKAAPIELEREVELQSKGRLR
jgi:hypothetical protein